MRNVRIDIGYNGANFFGSQRQPGVRTVQGELEDALEQVSGSHVALTFAGRTDRGVHAVGQVASGSVEWHETLEKLRYALDSITGPDLAVYDVAEVSESFNARFSAERREYRYRVWCGRRRPVLMSATTLWSRTGFDLNRLNGAAKAMRGEHDFRSFTGKGFGSGASTRNTRRTVFDAGWRTLEVPLEPGGELFEFWIIADSYLPHMVRNLVGAQIAIGRGDSEPDSIRELIAVRDREKAPPTAPPEGLVLWNVRYR